MRVAAERRKESSIFSKYQKSFDNSISILLSSKKGLKADAVFDFIFLSELSSIQVEQVLSKTMKTFTTYKEKKTTLDPVVSEKLLKLFALYNKGAAIFGSIHEFNKWMSEPAFGLGDQVPQQLLDTITGIELVAEELSRIEYGALA